MQAFRLMQILFSLIFVLLIAGCAAEDGDLTPPDAAYDGGVQTPTTQTSAILTGTMASDALITSEATPPAVAVITDRDNVNGTWECTVTNMVEGANFIFVYATDVTGNTRIMQIRIDVDLTGPITTINQFPEISQAGVYNIAGTVSEAGSSVSVEVFDSVGVTTGITGTASVDADIWNVDLDLSGLDGDYTLVATGTDRLGNDSVTPAEQLITMSAASPGFAITAPAVLPVILNTDIDSQLFAGTALASSTLSVTPSTAVTEPDALGDWDATVSGIAGGTTVVTFDVNTGGMIQKVLVVRDQTAPTVVEWTSLTNSTVTIEFNESMNAATISPENLVIEDSDNGTPFPVQAVAGSDRTFTFTTTDPLPVGRAYNATLQLLLDPADCSVVDGCTVEDGRGNSLSATYVWRFNK